MINQSKFNLHLSKMKWSQVHWFRSLFHWSRSTNLSMSRLLIRVTIATLLPTQLCSLNTSLSPGTCLPNQINFSHSLACLPLFFCCSRLPLVIRVALFQAEFFNPIYAVFFFILLPSLPNSLSLLLQFCFVVPPAGNNSQSHPHEIINLIIFSSCRARSFFSLTSPPTPFLSF